MATGKQHTVLRHLRKIVGVPDYDDPPDRLLLERFAATRDEDAFAALVKRHEALVWGVCWRSLRHAQDAEDCFQATFVVLARRAGSIRWSESVANWLYGVAWRVAAEAKSKRARRQSRERQSIVISEEKPMPDEATRELCAVLDDELKSLPQSHREPLVLCYLERNTTDQAARQLGWSQRTLERRLAQGLERLRARLTRRGLTLTGVLLGVVLAEQNMRAAAPAGLMASTIKSANTATAGISATVLTLADATSKGMTMTKLKLTAAVVFLLGTMVGAGVLFGQGAVWHREAKQATNPDFPEPPQPRDRDPVIKPAINSGEGPADDLARRTWAILEVVEKNHRQPPPRQEVILKGAQALLKAANVVPPEDLARRVNDVASEDRLRTLLHEIWPKDKAVKVEALKLETALLDGMFESIPGKPHLQSEATLKIQDQLRGNRYVGTGIQIGVHEKEKLVQIVIPFRRGPARNAGAQPGDLIVEVDGKSTLGMVDLEAMTRLLRGPEGTSVTIVVRQPGATEQRTLKVTRGVIPIDSVYGFRRAGEDGWEYVVDKEARIAYVWVKSITAGTLHELKQVENRLRADGMRALVLDFRFSRGEGHLHDAGLVAGGLLDASLMWTATDAHNPPKAWHAGRDPLFRDWPFAVLVNDIEDNAQGAVLAALQDNRRAVLVGEATKTDGAVRRLFQLPNQDGNITFLTGQLERADKARGWPVRPDRLVELSKDQRTALEQWLMTKPLPVLPPGSDDRAPADPQFDAAVTVLRDALQSGDSKKERGEKEGK